MNRKYRKAILAGNWKMNKGPAETRAFFAAVKGWEKPQKTTAVICAPALDLYHAVKAAKGTSVEIGAQNLHHAESGAYTGEISAGMLSEVGCKYVLCGHSERRDMGETDETVRRKVIAALEKNLRPILCVGESLDIRSRKVWSEFLRMQIKLDLDGVTAQQMRRVIIAYEPIWAIGTGVAATAQEAQDACAAIRDCLRQLYGARVARAVSILYGGSMKPSNAQELLAQPDIDGGLIGGASLDPASFIELVKQAENA